MPTWPKLYRPSPAAEADLEGIWRFTPENWSVARADRYHALMVAGLEAIAADRARSRPADDIRTGYRCSSVDSHVVFFRESSGGVDVVRSLHQCMDFRRHL